MYVYIFRHMYAYVSVHVYMYTYVHTVIISTHVYYMDR